MNKPVELTETQKQIRRESLIAGGQQEAWSFVVQSNWQLHQIEEKLAEKEAHRHDPYFANGSMKEGASPRLFIDGYIAALKEAITIINAQTRSELPILG